MTLVLPARTEASNLVRVTGLRRRGGFAPATGAGTPARDGVDLTVFPDMIMDGLGAPRW